MIKLKFTKKKQNQKKGKKTVYAAAGEEKKRYLLKLYEDTCYGIHVWTVYHKGPQEQKSCIKLPVRTLSFLF